MYCKHCGKPNDDNSANCVYCGEAMTPLPISEAHAKKPRNPETGFLIVALLSFTAVSSWLYWDFGYSNDMRNKLTFNIFSISNVFYFIAQFVTIVVFVKKPAQKIFCALLGLISAGYTVYNLVQYFQNTSFEDAFETLPEIVILF